MRLFARHPGQVPFFACEVGGAVRLAAPDLRQQVEFLGSVMANFLPTLMNRRQIRWREVARLFETAGANAIPIISLVSVLVGLIIAFSPPSLWPSSARRFMW